MVYTSLFNIELPWEVTTLGEACCRGEGDIQTGPFGSQLHAVDYVQVGIPSIMPQNIGDNQISDAGIARITCEDAQRLSRYLVKAGDIVYSRRGDVERRALIREREEGWLCGMGCLRVRFGKGVVYPPYAAFYMVNLSRRLMRDRQDTDPTRSVRDLKAHYRGRSYAEEVIKLLPEKPEPGLLRRLLAQVTGLGRRM